MTLRTPIIGCRFFNDLLRNDYSGTGFITGGRKQVSSWLYESLLYNVPFDQMARELIAPSSDASRGFIDGIKWRGNVSAGQTVEIQFAQFGGASVLGNQSEGVPRVTTVLLIDGHLKNRTAWRRFTHNGNSKFTVAISRSEKTAKAGWLFPKVGTDRSGGKP